MLFAIKRMAYSNAWHKVFCINGQRSKRLLLVNKNTMQQNQMQTNSNVQENEKQQSKPDNAATKLVPQAGEIKNNDHDPGTGQSSDDATTENA